jgi:hypothetical protein
MALHLTGRRVLEDGNGGLWDARLIPRALSRTTNVRDGTVGQLLRAEDSMRRVVIVGVAIAVALIGYVAAGPFLVMGQIRSAVQQHDSEALSSHVDFPALRANLKDQLNVAYTREATRDLKENSTAALGAALAVSKVVDTAVDSLITPSGLTNLLAGTPSRRDGAEPGQASDQQAEPIRSIRYSYDSITRFSAWIKLHPADRDEARLVFTLDGLSWKLSNIVVPPALFDDSKKPSRKAKNRAPAS